MLGYLYQCREALLLAIEESIKFPALTISIEKFDDVSFEQDGSPIQQLQLKHHTQAGNLTDASADLWKTLRIWCEQVKLDPQLPFDRRLVILTTGVAPSGSICEKLRFPRESEENETEALLRLREVAATSTNQETALGRAAFLALSEHDQRNLVGSIRIHDNGPNIADAKSEIEEKLTFAAPHGKVANLVDHLEGWWFGQVVLSLCQADQPGISLLTLRQKIDEIGTAYRTGDLLLSPIAEIISEQAIAAAEGRTFVKQMQCVGLPDAVIDLAKRDYYRANAQRSAWMRENVLLDGEAQHYDNGLIDRWSRERLAMQSGGLPISDAQKKGIRQKFVSLGQSHDNAIPQSPRAVAVLRLISNASGRLQRWVAPRSRCAVWRRV